MGAGRAAEGGRGVRRARHLALGHRRGRARVVPRDVRDPRRDRGRIRAHARVRAGAGGPGSTGHGWMPPARCWSRAATCLARSTAVVRPDGVVRWVASTARRVASAHGSASRYVGAVRDTSDAHFAEDELRAVHEVSAGAGRLGHLRGAAHSAARPDRPARSVGRPARSGRPRRPRTGCGAVPSGARRTRTPPPSRPPPASSRCSPASESLAGRAWSTGGPVGTSRCRRRLRLRPAGRGGGGRTPRAGWHSQYRADVRCWARSSSTDARSALPSERMYRTLTTLSQGIGRFLSRRTTDLKPSPCHRGRARCSSSPRTDCPPPRSPRNW